MKILNFIREWILLFAILAGVLGYFLYVNLPFLDQTHEWVGEAVGIVQPMLIFAMLFLAFLRVNPKKLRFCRYHGWLLLFQTGLYLILAGILVMIPRSDLRVILEGAMICLICPTATAGAVITRKLGGSASHIITYTILINLVTSLVIPLTIPWVHPNPSMSAGTASLLILGKVFPLLLLPLVAAFLIRKLWPRLHFVLSRAQEVSFYLWVVALALATAVTTRYIVHSHVSVGTQLWLVLVSFICCILQFYLGWRVGKRYGDRITAGQSLGQKNTVLAIWMGYTFFTPITSVVGGFYSIWHNIINSWQLHQAHNKAAGKNRNVVVGEREKGARA